MDMPNLRDEILDARDRLVELTCPDMGMWCRETNATLWDRVIEPFPQEPEMDGEELFDSAPVVLVKKNWKYYRCVALAGRLLVVVWRDLLEGNFLHPDVRDAILMMFMRDVPNHWPYYNNVYRLGRVFGLNRGECEHVRRLAEQGMDTILAEIEMLRRDAVKNGPKLRAAILKAGTKSLFECFK